MISADFVYQTCRTITKEKTGEDLIPQKWQLFANTSQVEIFESYFSSVGTQSLQVAGSMMDSGSSLEEKINVFRVETELEYDALTKTWKYPTRVSTGTKVASPSVVEIEITIPDGAMSAQLPVEWNDIPDTSIGVFNGDSTSTAVLATSRYSINRSLANEVTGPVIVISGMVPAMITVSEVVSVPHPITPYKHIELRTDEDVTVDMISPETMRYVVKSPFTYPTATQPVGYRLSDGAPELSGFRVAPDSSALGLIATLIKRPNEVRWSLASTDRGLTYTDMSDNFELHAAERPILIQKILGYMGISMSIADLVNWSEQEESEIKQENV